MKLLTKNTDYAVRALITMAQNKGRISAAEISERQDIPYPFLRRILKTLADDKLIRAKEGAGGGVILSAEPGNIRLSDVIKIFQGDIRLSECMFRKTICANRPKCALRAELLRVSGMVDDEFGRLTIEKLAKKTGGIKK